MYTEKICIEPRRNVSLTAYLQSAPDGATLEKRPAILILPGGGYEFCSDREGDAIVGPFLQAGYQVFILSYSVGEYATWPNPLEDYEQTMEMIWENSVKWNIHKDKIAVIGFSAGGHLAACAATMSKHRPSAAILGYALTKGDDIRAYHASMPDAVSAVNSDTPPCFLFSSAADHVVPIDNSLCFMRALAENHITFESHIYAYGPHGFSTGDLSVNYTRSRFCDRVPHWVQDSIGWLKDLFGDFTLDGYTEIRCARTIDDDKMDRLSLDCTLGHVLSCPEAQEIIAPLIAQMKKFDAEKSDSKKPFLTAAIRLTLREIMEIAQYTEPEGHCIDSALRKIICRENAK